MAGLIALAPETRATAIRARYEELLSHPEEMDRRLEEMIVAEYALDAESLHSFTAARLRVLIGMAAEDVDRARRVARAGDAVFNRLPGAIAMRRTQIVQTIARSELTAAEVELLRELLPSLLQQLPRIGSLSGSAAESVAPGGSATRKPWWKVW